MKKRIRFLIGAGWLFAVTTFCAQPVKAQQPQLVLPESAAALLQEVTVRTDAARTAIGQSQWQVAMKSLQPALLILYGKSKEPNFNQELLREPLWLYALATAGAGEDALPEFEKFLLEFRGKLKPEVKADAYRRMASNILARMPEDAESSRTDEKALALRQKRKEAQERSRQLLLEAMQCVDQVSNKNSVRSLTVTIESVLNSLD